jgi:outer membrane protein assembly factor BamB
MRVEEVRVCRFCGYIDAVDRTGTCTCCGLYHGLAILPRQAAEQLARRLRLRVWRRRLFRLLLAGVVIGAVAGWALRAYFDRGIDPPRATTDISASIGPQTWAQVRRTPENTGFISDPAPHPQRIKWVYQTEKRLLASPSVVGNHVYLATEDGRTLALSRQTGQLVWAYANGGPSSSTPAVAGDSVVVASRPGRVVALSRDEGVLRWETPIPGSILASPIVVNGTVYVGAADRNLYALDAATGRRRWAFPTPSWVVSAVAHADNRVLVTSQGSLLYVVGSETGTERLVYNTGLGRQVLAGVAIEGDRAYFGSIGRRVWAIDWRSTTYPLERALLFWKTNLFLWGVLSKPPVQKGTLWSTRVGGDVLHTPALAHDTVYAAAAKGEVVALAAATGAKRWATDLGVKITAAPIVAGESVLIGTETGSVFGLDAHTGKVLWDFKTEDRITGSPIVVGDTMYVVSHDGKLYAVSS